MSLQEMLLVIRNCLRASCFTDVLETTGVSPGTFTQWRDEPPEEPSLSVFCRLARYAGLNPTLKQLEELL